MISSDEQLLISNTLNSANVIVEAVAGSGKTSTAELIAMEHNMFSILLLTYNKRLRVETQARAEEKGLINLTVHNYHSFAVKYYHHSCHEDSALKKHLKTPPNKTFRFNMLIIDEIQDMTKLYYILVKKIIKDNEFIPRICVLGDRYQSIYDFNGADPRYIIYADILFNLNNSPWEKLTLSRSFRVSYEHVEFLNNCVLKNNRMNSIKKTGSKPLYLICDAFGKRPFLQVMKYLKTYSCSDIFVLAPSIKSEGTPVKILANSLTKNGVNIYMPLSDNEKLDEDIIRHKLVFSSFHQIKGLERAVTIVFSFDKGYFDFCARNADPLECPNTIYVAITRSLQHMTLIHHTACHYLPFLNHKKIHEFCDCETVTEAITNKSINATYINKFRGKTMFDKVYPPNTVKVIDVLLNRTAKNIMSKMCTITCKDLCNNINAETIDHALTYIYQLTRNKPCMKGQEINLATKTNQAIINESVQEINETAIPANYEFINTGKMAIVESLNNNSFIKETETNYFKEDSDGEDEKEYVDQTITYDDMTIEKLLYISNKYMCLGTKVIYKLKQITNYKWLLPKHLERCMERLANYISENGIYKSRLCVSTDELRQKQLQSTYDCIDGNKIYKFICDATISNKSILEHAVNMYVYYRYHNIEISKTDEMISIEQAYNTLNKQINSLEYNSHIIGKAMPLITKNGIGKNTIKQINRVITSLKKKRQILFQNYISKESIYEFYILNISTNEWIEIYSTKEKLISMIEFIIHKKYYSSTITTDQEFLDQHSSI